MTSKAMLCYGMSMIPYALALSNRRIELPYQWKVALLIITAIVVLVPPTVIIASELGGYVSEKLIGRGGVSDSNLLIGRDGVADSLLNLLRAPLPPVPPFIDSNSPTGNLMNLLPIMLVFYAIYAILRILTGTPSITELLAVAVIVYILTASLSGLQVMLDDAFTP